MTLLSIRDACVGYGATTVVRDVSLDVRQGEIVALLGPSGCGKTTLLRAIAGFEPLRSGSIELAGACVSDASCCVPPERRRIGMVFQQGALFPHMTVQKNVAFGVAGDGTDRTREVLASMRLSDLARRFPDQLSGGQQQLVALARALAPRPDVILLDEPFNGLDVGLRESVRDRVERTLRDAGATAVLVTHDQQEAFGLADRVAVMQAGRVLQTDTPTRIYGHPATLEVARFVAGGRLLPARVEAGRLTCALGEWEVRAEDGSGFLLVRSEDLDFDPAGSGDGVAASVLRSRYRGHDRLHEVALDDGMKVQVRTANGRHALPDPARVRLRRGEYCWFPDGTPSSVRLELGGRRA